MALSDKNLVITPNIGAAADPKIVFSGADASTAAQNITLTAYPTNGGTLSFDGSTGQLFSVTNSMSGTIFSANDVSGIPSIEVIDTGLVKIAQYSGNVLLGSGTDTGLAKLQVTGSLSITGNMLYPTNSKSIYGPNTTWSSYLHVGGDGVNGITRTGSIASVVTTNGNLHLDSGSDKAMYLNYYSGSQGFNFGNGTNVTVNSNQTLHAGNYTSYSPTLTGGSASGTWGISVTGNSATVGGFTPTASNGVANRVVVADANGYIQNNYFYTSGGGSERSASGMGYFSGHNSSDYYIRSFTAAAAAALLSGQTMNIVGTASGETFATVTGRGATTLSNVIHGDTTGGTVGSTGVPGSALGTIKSARMMGKYTNAGGMGSYYMDYNSEGTVTLTDGTALAYLSFNIDCTANISEANALPAYGTSYGSKNAGMAFISGTQTDILKTVVGLAPVNTGAVNAVLLGYLVNGPRILIQDNTIGGTAATNVITYVATTHNFVGAIQQGAYQVLHANNYTSYSPTLTGGSASGTWGISVTGSAGSVTGGLKTINGSSIIGSGDIAVSVANFTSSISSSTVTPDSPPTINTIGYAAQAGLPFSQTDGGLYTAGYDAPSWKHQIFGDFRSGQVAVRGKNSGTWQAWRAVLDSSNYTNYAAGLSSSNSLTGANTFFANQNTASGSSPPLQVYGTTSGAMMAFHRGGYYAVNMGLDSDNVIRIGGWSAAANRFQMDMSGNLTMAGNVTAYSDERLKKDWELLPTDFVKNLALVKVGTFTRIDSNERQVGVSAQSLITLLPEAIQNDGEYLSVAYGNAALASAVELAKEVVSLNARIARLEALVSKLIEG